jgi:hypothetical protein
MAKVPSSPKPKSRCQVKATRLPKHGLNFLRGLGFRRCQTRHLDSRGRHDWLSRVCKASLKRSMTKGPRSNFGAQCKQKLPGAELFQRSKRLSKETP